MRLDQVLWRCDHCGREEVSAKYDGGYVEVEVHGTPYHVCKGECQKELMAFLHAASNAAHARKKAV